MNALVNPSVRQISAQIDVVLRHDPSARVVGIRSQTKGDWPAQVMVGERSFEIAWCPSPIVVREKLVTILSNESEADDHSGLVVMTPLSDQLLGADVLGRFSRGKVFSVEAWDMVRHAFQARDIDARLARWTWVAEALLENLPADGYPPARGGVLEVDTAWAQVLRSVLGLATDHGGRPDLPSLLRWSLSPDAMLRYGDLPDKARRQIGLWLIEVLGSCGELVGQIIEAGYGGELLPISLVCGMVFQHCDGNKPLPPDVLASAVRMERFTGGSQIAARDGLRLHKAAVQVILAMDASSAMPVLDVADKLAESLHLLKHAHLSDDLPAGFNARLLMFAELIEDCLGKLPGKPEAVPVGLLLAAGEQVRKHRLAQYHPHRLRRVEMAIRLTRWLVLASSAQPKSGRLLSEIAREYADDGAFVDWARLSLFGGDELSGVSRAFGALREAVRGLREQQNLDFAQALSSWNAAGCLKVTGVTGVESIIADVVAPVAASVPVLVLVVDGLSWPIFLELMEDLQRQGWSDVLPQGITQSPVGLATIPSITELSRTSLFCGSVLQGQAANEKTGFSQHPALMSLVSSNRNSAKPVLFHKGDLTSSGDGSSLSEAVRDAIGSRERKVVGVVFNGVDDHLSGSDQLNQRWTLDDLRLIKPLLYEARNAGRLVLITADHGHVIDEATQAWSNTEKQIAKAADADKGDRWRYPVNGELAPGEILFSGGRVKDSRGERKVVVPWSESLRYGSHKNGYHGGVTLQEMLVPVVWLVTASSIPDGFRAAPHCLPDWWEARMQAKDSSVETAEVSPPVRNRTTQKKSAQSVSGGSRQQALFELPVEPESASASVPSNDMDWIQVLLVSPVFMAQKQWAARAAIKDEEIRALLEALSERGGRLAKSALASRLSMPLMRVSGFINAARRLLNVDQSPVLVLDESDGSVLLNRQLLDLQFQLTSGGSR